MLKALAEAGGKVIGGARFSLTSVLPSVLLVTIVAAVERAGLYDLGARPDFSAVQPGKDDTAAVVLFVFFAFVFGVLIRPFEAAIVQLLEGYWERPSPLAPLREAAVERHRRRRDRAAVVLRYSEDVARAERSASASPGARPHGGSVPLRELAERDRRSVRLRRRAQRARRIRAGYPTEIRPDDPQEDRDSEGELLPTSLGNMLLRAERLSGDRYGLDMSHVYPRIYPFIAPRMESAVTQQLSLIAATASLAVSLGIATLAMLPLVLRGDAWSLLPLAPAVLTVLAYRGAVSAAAFHGTLLSAVFDVHRFDLIKAFHYPVPRSADRLVGLNMMISEYLAQDEARLDQELDLPMKHEPESDDVLHRANGNGPTQA
ncbi:hypothetical protein [Streptomyces canus]|uniref:hypothetical protein n=1 Tax=Streptomyces canus TaxID=58343 RepID=UPI00037FFEC0|nr:hypothetical protein [Streptomyces canus]